MKITLMTADDWRAIFVDEEVYTQGHSVPEWEWLDLLRMASEKTVEVDDDWCDHSAVYEYLDRHGQFYESLTKTLEALELIEGT